MPTKTQNERAQREALEITDHTILGVSMLAILLFFWNDPEVELIFTMIVLGPGLAIGAAQFLTSRKLLFRFLSPAILGIETGFFLLGLVYLHRWYSNPEIANLEPLTGIMAFAVAGSEFARQTIQKIEIDNAQPN